MWKLIFSKIDKILNSIKGIADTVSTTDEERGNIVKNIEEIKADLQIAYENALTERHKADMQSDSWLSKNIRPLTLIFLMFAFILFASLDGLGCIDLNESYIELIRMWGEVALMFYFGSRGVEKTARITDALFRKKRR